MNHSESFSFADIGSEWSISKLLLFTFLGLVTVITVFGNAVVLYVFAKSGRSLRSPIHLLLANLAFADFLVGVMVMPGLTFFTVLDYKWLFGDIPCMLHDYVHFTLCATSMFSMVAICVERYVGLKYPLHHKRVLTTRRVRLLCAAVWILAILLTTASLTIWPNKESPSLYTCPPNLRHDFIFFISVSLYWLPIATMAYIYWIIYKVSAIPPAELMKWANKSLGSTIVSTASTKSFGLSRKGGRYKSDEDRWEKASRKQGRLLRQVSKLVGVMLLFYGPLFGIFVLNSFNPNLFSINTLIAFAWLRYFTSCSNTFLYIHVMPYYKRQLLRLICNVGSNGTGGDRSEASNSAGLSSTRRESNTCSYSSRSAGEAVKIEVVVDSSSGPSTQMTTTGSLSESQRSNQKYVLDKGELMGVDINEMDRIMAQIQHNL